jgi:hypothetical protein
MIKLFYITVAIYIYYMISGLSVHLEVETQLSTLGCFN